MQIEEFCQQVPNFATLSFTEKIKLFGWYLSAIQGQAHFTGSQLNKCFKDLHVAGPTSISPLLNAMAAKKPPELLRSCEGYCLERQVREQLDAKYAQRSQTVHVHKLLTELPAQIPSIAEKTYLEESIICFRHGAFKAAIVMCWNLAYDHLCEIVLTKHLTEFNTQLPKTYPKADIAVIIKKDDFSELKEFQVIQVCRSAGIVSNSLHKILKEKLDRRNIAAHPSGVMVSQPTAEEFIKDLVENVVLKLV